jgi:hypothetical protein
MPHQCLEGNFVIEGTGSPEVTIRRLVKQPRFVQQSVQLSKRRAYGSEPCQNPSPSRTPDFSLSRMSTRSREALVQIVKDALAVLLLPIPLHDAL